MASVRLAALGDCGVTGRAEGRRGPVLDGGGGESRLSRLPVGSGGPSRSCIRPRGAAVVLPPPAPRDADRSELHQEHHHADDCRQDRGDINQAHLLLPLLRLSRGRSPAAARCRGRRTAGQPWLVNALCWEACFENQAGRDRSRAITEGDILDAQERLILARVTHLDDLADKLREDRVRRVVAPMLTGDADRGKLRRPEPRRGVRPRPGLAGAARQQAPRQPDLRGGDSARADVGGAGRRRGRDRLVRGRRRRPGHGQAPIAGRAGAELQAAPRMHNLRWWVSDRLPSPCDHRTRPPAASPRPPSARTPAGPTRGCPFAAATRLG